MKKMKETNNKKNGQSGDLLSCGWCIDRIDGWIVLHWTGIGEEVQHFYYV